MADIVQTNPGGLALAKNPAFGATLERMRGFAGQPAVRKSMPAAGLVAVLGAGALVWSALSAPPQRDLFTGLGDADKAAVADVLTTSGIAYDLDNRSGALSVSEADYYRAKMMLAQQGLPKAAPAADSIIGAIPMGASRAVEGERLRAAQETDLARTIEAIDAVTQARVHIAAEQASVFVRDRAAPAASVMLTLRQGRSLSDGQVRAIAQLVAASVPGLAADGVSIVDQTGALLSGGASDPSAQAAQHQLDIQKQIERNYLDGLQKLLIPLVGQGNFSAEVHADVDFTETQATRESVPKDTSVLRQEQGGWSKDPNGASPPSGIPGYLSNQAPAAAQVTPNNPANPDPAAPPAPGAAAAGTATATPGSVPADRTSETFNRTFELGHEVSVTKNAVGTVRRLSIAVALRDPEGKKRSKAEVAAIEALVKGAIGYDQQRGDVVALSSNAFAAETVEKQPWWEQSWVGTVARNVSALLVAALLVFGIGRPLLAGRRAAAKAAKEQQATAQAALPDEIRLALAESASGTPGMPVTLDMIEAAPSYETRAQLIRNFVRQDPARAALVVRDLIRADMAKDTADAD
ncbi:MAG: flagellar basal-body MS-ring/collar protein FliF [Sphingomonas sp.]